MAGTAAAPRAFAGAVLLSLAFGSVHAFAILMAPLEKALSASRAEVSLIYALAIASLTAGVFAAPRLMRWGTRSLALVCGAVSALGIAATGLLASLSMAWIGYGLTFGFFNGVAYSLFLTRAAAAFPGAQGVAVGAVTATYGLGAALAAQALGWAVQSMDVPAVMTGLAVTILAASATAAMLFPDGATVPSRSPEAGPYSCATIVWLWAVYFLGASGGLMVIAHAAGLMSSPAAANAAPTVVAIGNVAGSLLGGAMAGRQMPRHALAIPLVVIAGSLAVLLMLPAAALSALAICGLGYGWLIAAVPVVIRKVLGDVAFASAFGRVFTAWGVAGLLAPTVAGLLFDRSGGYGLAVAIALAAASAGALLAMMGRKI